MSRKLPGFFSSALSKMRSQLQEPPAQKQPTSEPANKTAELMLRIKSARTLLTVKITGSDDTYLSALLEVNTDEEYIVLDELNSPTGRRQLERVRQIQIQTRLNSMDISFDAEVSAIGEQDGIAYYKIPFPENMDYQQRRNFVRVDVPEGEQLPVHLQTETDELVSGELSDISLGGFSIKLRRATADKIHRGDFIPKCTIYLNDQKPIEAEFEVCYCESKNHHKQPRLGGRFTQIGTQCERQLQRYVAELDRQTVKLQ